jgi:chemotaxis protein methyltransferase CheR
MSADAPAGLGRKPAAAARVREPVLPNGEFPFSQANFRVISGIMMAEAGISLGEGKANLVYSRLAKRLRRLGLADFDSYCRLVEAPDGEAERQAMIAALTTNVTRFFREPHHFEHLKTAILPVAIEELKRGGRVRFWSAACSSGQEPYSIALTILSMLPDAASRDIKVLATDIDHNMVAKGAAGVYDANLLGGIQPALLQRWFQRGANGAYEVGPELRALVAFRRLNLIETWPMRSKFHAIFCRNVVIYFDHETQMKLWSRMVPLLHGAGALYIGHSERVAGPAATQLVSDGITTYRHAQRKAG